MARRRPSPGLSADAGVYKLTVFIVIVALLVIVAVFSTQRQKRTASMRPLDRTLNGTGVLRRSHSFDGAAAAAWAAGAGVERGGAGGGPPRPHGGEPRYRV